MIQNIQLMAPVDTPEVPQNPSANAVPRPRAARITHRRQGIHIARPQLAPQAVAMAPPQQQQPPIIRVLRNRIVYAVQPTRRRRRRQN